MPIPPTDQFFNIHPYDFIWSNLARQWGFKGVIDRHYRDEYHYIILFEGREFWVGTCLGRPELVQELARIMREGVRMVYKDLGILD